MREDWVAHFVNKEGLVLLVVNYAFFSIIVLSCLIFLLCLAHAASPPTDMLTSLMLLALSFVMVNVVLADYVVNTMRTNKELRTYI